MLHSLATAQVSLEDDSYSAHALGGILLGPARPDLIRDELLCEIFAATVASRPAAAAMITAEGRLTYAEIDARAENLARRLVQKGVHPGRIVGLWMPRGHELLIAQIAIAKTGAAWLPFDADAPSERSRHLPFRRRSLGRFDQFRFRGNAHRALPGLDHCWALGRAC